MIDRDQIKALGESTFILKGASLTMALLQFYLKYDYSDFEQVSKNDGG